MNIYLGITCQRHLHVQCDVIGIYLSSGPINPCDFIRYLLIYGNCLDPPARIQPDLYPSNNTYKIYCSQDSTIQNGYKVFLPYLFMNFSSGKQYENNNYSIPEITPPFYLPLSNIQNASLDRKGKPPKYDNIPYINVCAFQNYKVCKL